MKSKEVFEKLFKEKTKQLVGSNWTQVSKRAQGSNRTHHVEIAEIADKIVQSNLKATTKMALLYLLIKEGKGTFKTSIRKVQKQTGLSLSSVKRMFSELKEAGIVERQNSEGSVFKLDTWVQNEHT